MPEVREHRWLAWRMNRPALDLRGSEWSPTMDLTLMYLVRHVVW
jgi:hypothetical protein